MTCKGIEIEPGKYSGCLGGTDCPACRGRDIHVLELIKHLADSGAAEATIPREWEGRQYEVSVVAVDECSSRARLSEDVQTGIRGWRVLSRMIDDLEAQIAALKAQIGGAA